MRLTLTTILLIASISSGWAAPALSLKECFDAALKNSETIRISEADIRAARGRYAEALGQVVPIVTARATDLFQDTSGNSRSNDVNSTFTRSSRPEVSINVSQNLFQGLKAYAALKGSKADTSRLTYMKHEAARLLYADVATVFYTILRLEREIALTRDIISVWQDRQKEMSKWLELGKTRASEAASLNADLALLEADLILLRGDRKVAYEALSFLTGLSPQPPIRSNTPFPSMKGVEYYVTKGKERPDLMAFSQAIAVARGSLGIAKSELAPDVDVSANYYPYRVGYQESIHWDALFSISLPLFDWGRYGTIKRTKAEVDRATLEYSQKERMVVRDIVSSYERLKSARERYNALSRATALAKESFELNRSDFEVTLVTSTDVLSAQRIWLEAARRKNVAEMEARLSFEQLKAAAGEVPGT